jgi:hypothetical protein
MRTMSCAPCGYSDRSDRTTADPIVDMP